MSNGYSLTSWADGFNRWYCRADFEFPGLGNTYEAEKIKYRALDACKRKIREEITSREAKPIRRLSYYVSDNKIDTLNRLHSITVAEKF